MKKYLKLISGALAILAVVFMFFTQVVIKWSGTGLTDMLGFKALVGGTYPKLGTQFSGVGSGLAGYILVGVGGILILLCALIPFFKEHDVLSMVIVGIGAICIIVGVVLLFLIRKNFADANGLLSKDVYVGWAAITAGSLGSLGAAGGILSIVLDLLEK